MRVGSLFSGIGGIELGFEREGFTTIWCVEREPYCQEILRQHFPNATIYDDVTTINFATLPRVDVLTGGFPCQDISDAGARAGITGSRSILWKYFFEAIRILRPKIAFIENVSALTHRGLDVVLADLASLGTYDVEWHCVPASGVGAFHRRDRIFIIAYIANTTGDGFQARREQCTESAKRPTELTQVSDAVGDGCNGHQCSTSECEGKSCATVGRVCSGEIPDASSAGLEEQGLQSGLHVGQQPFLADTDEFGCRRRDKAGQGCAEDGAEAKGRSCAEECSGASGAGLEGREHQERQTAGQGVWAAQSPFRGVVDGIPRGLHTRIWKKRIEALGNSVVPQVAQAFARTIKKIYQEDGEGSA